MTMRVRLGKHGYLLKRFWARVMKGDGCWNWTGSHDCHGYGTITNMGHRIAAHRVSWKIHFGEIPIGLYVLHRCDNRPCVNPSHLFLGTHQDNMDDMKAKGRAHRPCKLTAENVAEIRHHRAVGTRCVDLASRFGVSKQNISDILHGRSWR